MNDNGGLIASYVGIPMIVVPTIKKQNRTHRKKRINKKWAKKYGFVEHETIENDKVIILDGKMYMNQNTFYKMKLHEL